MKFTEFIKEFEVMQQEIEEEAKAAEQRKQQLELKRFKYGR